MRDREEAILSSFYNNTHARWIDILRERASDNKGREYSIQTIIASYGLSQQLAK